MAEIKALSQTLGQQLLRLGWTVTTAESCTGGGISAAITDIAGSSNYFNCAFVTYSNEAKSALVEVSPTTLAECGAVSQQVVEQMAAGAARKAGANMAIAVSGVAGPGGGTTQKPVGTVWIAIYIDSLSYSDNTSGQGKPTVWHGCFQFDGDRSQVRQQTVKAALTKALALLKEKNS